MSLSLQVQLKQSQTLALTPQMLQSMKVLQLSHSELTDYIQEEVEKNPLLELDNTAELPSYSHTTRSSHTELSDISEIYATKPSLQDELAQNLYPHLKTEEDKAIAEKLINAIDEAGYITELPDEFDAEDVEAILALLQQNAPAGIGARDLKQCLTLQLKAKNRYDAIIATLLDNLDLLARRDYAKLKLICSCDDDDLSEMIKDIRDLDPKPGLKFDHAMLSPPEPDVIVTHTTIQLNARIQPRLQVNMQYRRELKCAAKKEPEKAYLKNITNNANGLFKMLKQRNDTLLKVSVEIMKHQQEFLEKGKAGLKSLTLKQVADEIEMHESTISRAISHKTMLTPQGLYELKFFFTNAVGIEGTASEVLRDRIKGLIELETKVLSDDDLVIALKAEGMELARRTVAKYRESLHIPSSVLRRREKTLK